MQRYCSRECQVKHWSRHKAACAEAVAAKEKEEQKQKKFDNIQVISSTEKPSGAREH